MVGNRGYTRIVGLLPGTVYEAAVVALGDGETWSDSIIKDYLLFKTEVQKMSNQQFGAAQIGRAQTNGRFYAIPAANVAANVIYMPAYSTSPFFGIAEAPVPAGQGRLQWRLQCGMEARRRRGWEACAWAEDIRSWCRA